ncbi:MFS-type transporter, putative [Plasmodium malariae]|uniref:MFS-type transporter, putative n=1 Tax=Plasmodium malariae TaxID=5858 RepID=A0A1A8W6P0_PLAMA|nr:MFS-type transporter, putative [Plasmodium malariae]
MILKTREVFLNLQNNGRNSRSSQSGLPKLYKRRWVMLFYFSYCCMVDNLICFTFAPINDICYSIYGSSNKIFAQVYFIVYSVFSIPLSFLLSEFSLRSNVMFSSFLQFFGCLLRYIYWNNFKIVMFGQFVSSIGQVIFVNAPPEFSLVWFPVEERIISTSTSIISNVLGTAIIYLYAPFIVVNNEDVKKLLFHICFISFLGFLQVTLFFESVPPSTVISSISDKGGMSLSFTKNDNIYKEVPNERGDVYILGLSSIGGSNLSGSNVGVSNVEVSNAEVSNVEVSNAEVSNAEVSNAEVSNAEVSNVSVYNASSNNACIHNASISNARVSNLSVCNTTDGKKSALSVTHLTKELMRFLSDLSVEVGNILHKKDFIKILIIFCYSECIISSFSADMSIVLKEKLINKSYFAISGSLFIFNTILGSAILCFNANNKYFKKLIVLCICMIMVVCVLLNFTNNEIFIIITLSLIGFWSGPIQPLTVEMASITVHPISSNLCTSVLQVISLSVSAVFISLISYITPYVHISIFLFNVSFFVLIISLLIKTTQKKRLSHNNLTVSVRSGLINRHTFDTQKYTDFFYKDDKTVQLLKNYKDLYATSNHKIGLDENYYFQNYFSLWRSNPSQLPYYVDCSQYLQHAQWDITPFSPVTPVTPTTPIVPITPISPIARISACLPRSTSKCAKKSRKFYLNIKEQANCATEDLYRFHLSDKLDIKNLKKELLFYNQKMEGSNEESKFYSRFYRDDYGQPFHFGKDRNTTFKYNSY